MVELKSNLNKSWGKVSDLINSLTPIDGKFSQIDIDLLLSATRNFYQDIHDLNTCNNFLNNTVPNVEKEQLLAGNFKANSTSNDDKIEREELMKNMEFFENRDSEKSIFQQEKYIAKQPYKESYNNTVLEEDAQLNQEKGIDISIENAFEPNESSATETNSVSLKEVLLNPETSTDPKQSSLFEYLQANNIEKAAQNISKYIETEQKAEIPLTIADKFKPEQPSVIEKITPKTEEHSIGTKIQQQTVYDLRDIIGINEKFLFINELFSGNMKEYTDFIMHLNSLHSKEEVDLFLQDILSNRKWIETAHAYTTLTQIIKRRFF